MANFPKFSYGGGPTVLTLSNGPQNFLCYWVPQSKDNVSNSGLRARTFIRQDMIVTFSLKYAEVNADLPGLQTLVNFLLAGNTADFYPSADLAAKHFHVIDWDGSLAALGRTGYRRYAINFVLQIVPDSQLPVDPSYVMRWFHGINA